MCMDICLAIKIQNGVDEKEMERQAGSLGEYLTTLRQ